MKQVITFWLIVFTLIGVSLFVNATTGGYSLPDFNCPAGTFVSGAKWGKFICSPPPAPKKLVPRGYGQ